MKIVLVGNSSLTLTVCWGICQSEIAQHVVILSGTQTGNSHRVRSPETISQSLMVLTILHLLLPSVQVIRRCRSQRWVRMYLILISLF